MCSQDEQQTNNSKMTKTNYDKKTEKLAKAYAEFMNMPRMEYESEHMWHDRLARLMAWRISPTAVGWAVFGGKLKPWSYTVQQGNLFIFLNPTPKTT